MELSEHRNNHPNTIQSADASHCSIGGTKHQSTIAIPSYDKTYAVDIKSIDELDDDTVERLCQEQPEVLIIATGDQIEFPSTTVLDPLVKRHIGLEILDNQAAARTFNVLLGEDRKAICLMIITA